MGKSVIITLSEAAVTDQILAWVEEYRDEINKIEHGRFVIIIHEGRLEAVEPRPVQRRGFQFSFAKKEGGKNAVG